jgi:hypothetical protein
MSAAMPAAPTRKNGNGVASKRRGMKRDMRCRYPGCKNRSKGPRFRFLCEEHLKLPKKKQDEVLAKWEARSAWPRGPAIRCASAPDQGCV